VTGREHDAIAVRPVRIGRVVPDVAHVKRVGQRSERHRRAGMPRFCRLNRIHGEGANGIDGELLQGGVGQRHGLGHGLGEVVGSAEGAFRPPRKLSDSAD
jgi:hypothetical protein